MKVILCLQRDIRFFVSRNGVLVFAKKGSQRYREYSKGLSFLPCASVDTVREAEGIQIWLCRLSREDGETYYLNSFDGTLEGVQRLGFEIENLYHERKARKAAGRRRTGIALSQH